MHERTPEGKVQQIVADVEKVHLWDFSWLSMVTGNMANHYG